MTQERPEFGGAHDVSDHQFSDHDIFGAPSGYEASVPSDNSVADASDFAPDHAPDETDSVPEDALDSLDEFASVFDSEGPDDPAHHFVDDAADAEVSDYRTGPLGQARPTRAQARQQQRERKQRSRGRLITVLAIVLIAAVGGVGWFVVRPAVISAIGGSDYSGAGTGSVLVQINPGDGATAIAKTLHSAGVTKSDRAFVVAAANDSDSKSIQPGFYQLHKQMKATLALTALLDPSARVSANVTIPEGSTLTEIYAKLAGPLKLSVADLKAAAASPAGFGLPAGYAPASGPLTSLEGFAFPDTYSFDPGTSATDALATMTSEFVATDRSLHFADSAKQLNLTPYQALIIASMVEGEAKFDADRPKVARVILNRLAANEPLGIDATSIYGAELAGRDPNDLTYNETDPYNTRHTLGLPPTPIDNPGAASLKAVINPASGDWTHYVNGDAEGHLVFTDEAGFEAARQACVDNHWGCD